MGGPIFSGNLGWLIALLFLGGRTQSVTIAIAGGQSMYRTIRAAALGAAVGIASLGCATQKETHTPRTGIEQLLISSAVDHSLDRFDLTPLAHKSVYVEAKYLDCVDKNYIVGSLRSRLLNLGCKLVDKLDASDAIVEIYSGGVGTDSQELFVGVPEIPLPPPSPIAIPRVSLLKRTKQNGTAKLMVMAYDTHTRAALIHGGISLARSECKNWNILGAGPVQTGSVPNEILAATGEADLDLGTMVRSAKRALTATAVPAPLFSPSFTSGSETLALPTSVPATATLAASEAPPSIPPIPSASATATEIPATPTSTISARSLPKIPPPDPVSTGAYIVPVGVKINE